MTLVGVIADTHGLLRAAAIDALSGVDHILHAGDIGDPEIVPRLSRIAPVTAIRGNIDRAAWAQPYPETASVTIGDRRIFLIHDRAELGFDPAGDGYDIVVSGHSHRVRVEAVDGVLFLNPGSAGPRRFRLPITLARLRLGSVEPEIVHLA